MQKFFKPEIGTFNQNFNCHVSCFIGLGLSVRRQIHQMDERMDGQSDMVTLWAGSSQLKSLHTVLSSSKECLCPPISDGQISIISNVLS